MLESYLKKD
jgi:ribonucleoside-triphosphate reductase